MSRILPTSGPGHSHLAAPCPEPSPRPQPRAMPLKLSGNQATALEKALAMPRRPTIQAHPQPCSSAHTALPEHWASPDHIWLSPAPSCPHCKATLHWAFLGAPYHTFQPPLPHTAIPRMQAPAGPSHSLRVSVSSFFSGLASLQGTHALPPRLFASFSTAMPPQRGMAPSVWLGFNRYLLGECMRAHLFHRPRT